MQLEAVQSQSFDVKFRKPWSQQVSVNRECCFLNYNWPTLWRRKGLIHKLVLFQLSSGTDKIHKNLSSTDTINSSNKQTGYIL